MKSPEQTAPIKATMPLTISSSLIPLAKFERTSAASCPRRGAGANESACATFPCRTRVAICPACLASAGLDDSPAVRLLWNDEAKIVPNAAMATAKPI